MQPWIDGLQKVGTKKRHHPGFGAMASGRGSTQLQHLYSDALNLASNGAYRIPLIANPLN